MNNRRDPLKPQQNISLKKIRYLSRECTKKDDDNESRVKARRIVSGVRVRTIGYTNKREQLIKRISFLRIRNRFVFYLCLKFHSVSSTTGDQHSFTIIFTRELFFIYYRYYTVEYE